MKYKKHILEVSIIAAALVIGFMIGKRYTILNANIWHDSDHHYMEIDGNVHIYD